MKRKTVIVIHLLFWFYMINQALFPIYVGGMKDVQLSAGEYLKDVLFSVFLNAITFYIVYFSFPWIFNLRNKFLAVLSAVVFIVFLTFFRFGFNWVIWTQTEVFKGSEMYFEMGWFWNELRLCIITSIYAILIRFLIRAVEAHSLRNELINQQQASELALLKAKMNPHFLFNTLNNIYSLVYKKSDEAPEAVMKFSSIMRYVLTETNSETVPLDKEIDYLRNYIELQELRFKQPGFVDYSIIGMTENLAIPPMLLIPLVENAFKHGSRSHHPGVIIRLKVENRQIQFSVINNIKENLPVDEKQPNVLGISNIRRRLDLIYPGKHQLKIEHKGGQFKINLVIDQ
jgi:two-component system, LytTR family, sensor kinase